MTLNSYEHERAAKASHHPDSINGLKTVCKSCGNTNPSRFKFCGECGKPIKTDWAIEAGETPGRSERKIVTVIFTDITGYTGLSEKLDPEDINQLMAHIFRKINEVVTKYQGTIVKYLGDAAMIVFGVPAAHADDPARAIRAALEIHQSVRDIDLSLTEKIHWRMAMHTGINTGLVITECAKNGVFDVTGDTVNIASRLTNLAGRNEIIVGPGTYRQANGEFIFKQMKPARVKGKSQPIDTHKLLFPRKKSNIRPPKKLMNADLVGREEPFARFMAAIERLESLKSGGIVTISGDAGIGKSRLIAEVKAQVGGHDIRFLKGKSMPYGHKTSYGPFLDILKTTAGIGQEEADETALKKLTDTMNGLFPDTCRDILPYIANLLDLKVTENLSDRTRFLDGEAMGHQIFRSVYQLLEKLARKKPLILIFEDVHWLDTASLKLIRHLLPLTTESPIMIVTAGRVDPSSHGVPLMEIIQNDFKEHVTAISLSALTYDGVGRMIRVLLNIDAIPEGLFSIIYEKSGGNPFFVEEILRSLIDKKAIIRDKPKNQWQITSSAEKVAIPETLRGLITDRMDRLEEDERQVLKTASIIGRHFLYSILETICDTRLLDEKMITLEEVDFIRKNNHEITAQEYLFQHALTQEAAYESILKSRRKELHQKVATAIETIFPDRIEEFYSKLAFHFAHAEEWKKAKEYLVKAGDRAEEIADDAEALEHYKKTMIACEKISEKAWDPLEQAILERKMGEAFFHHGDHQNAVSCFERALAGLSHPLPSSSRKIRWAIVKQILLQSLHRLVSFGKTPFPNEELDRATQEIFRIYEIMGWIDYFMNRERLLLNVITGLNHAERKKSLSGIARGSMGVGLILNTLGMFSLAGYYSEKALRLAKKTGNPMILGLGYLGVSVHREFQAKWSEAIELYDQCGNAYWKAGDTRKWGNATIWTAFLHHFKGEFKKSLELSNQVHQIGKESGDRLLQGWGLHGQGLNLACSGDLDQAISTLEVAIRLLNEIPDMYDGAQALTDLGRCYLYKGEIDAGISVLEKTGQMIRQNHLRGPMVSLFKNALVHGYLLAWEKEGRGKATGKRVKSLIEDALKTNLRFKCGLPQTYRHTGTYYFLKGKEKKARKEWLKSIHCAEELGAPFEKALAHLEIGKRLGDEESRSVANEIFLELKTTAD